MWKCFGWTSACAFFLTCTGLQAALLQEDWASGTIGGNWVVSENEPGDIELEDQGGGDWALALRGIQDPASPSSPSWSDNIRSANSFSRGDNLVVEFLTWIKPAINTQVGIHGPFHNVAASASYQNIEAGFDYFVNDIRISEATYDGFNGIQSGVSVPAFTAALSATNRKSNSLLVRVTLDSVRGSKFEYATNGGAGPLVTLHDTLGDPTYVGQGVKNTGSGSPVWLGWGLGDGLAGTLMIDNIVLKSVPEPSSALLALAGCVGLFLRRRR